ncbi:MAG: fibronectin type III domain-containing protein [bacterium]
MRNVYTLKIFSVIAFAVSAIAFLPSLITFGQTTNLYSTSTNTTGTSTQNMASGGIPIISQIVASSSENGTSATITWITNQNAISNVVYGVNTFYGASTTLDQDPSTNHSSTLFGLIPNTIYHFKIIAMSTSSNIQGASGDHTFFTGATTSVATSTNSTSSSMVTVLQPRISITANGITSTEGNISVGITNLTPNTVYNFSGIITDTAGNTIASSTRSFTTTNGNTITTSDSGRQALLINLQTQLLLLLQQQLQMLTNNSTH